MSFKSLTSPSDRPLEAKVSGFTYLPTEENRLAWLNLELKGRLPGFKRRFLIDGETSKSLAIFGEHEDDISLAEKKRRWMERWIEQLSAINALYYNIQLRIEVAIEKIDLEIEIIEDRIDDLERMGHTQEAQALRQEKKELEDVREDFVEAQENLNQAQTLEQLEQVDKKVERGENRLLLLIRAIFHRKKPAADFSHEAHIRPDTSERETEARSYYRYYEETRFSFNDRPSASHHKDDEEDEEETEQPAQEPV